MTIDLLESTPEALVDALRAQGLRRGFVVADRAGRLRASHSVLEGLAGAVGASPDYRAHEACFFAVGEESGHLLAAFLHDTRRGQGAGGLRFWTYGRLADLVRDGLRLSHGMGQKSALAGLWWGGGKGIVARHPDHDHRDPAVRGRVFRDYGRFVSSLRGCYITAEDVGATPADMVHIHETTRFATCVAPAIGGSGNPSRLTAHGVVVAMEAARAFSGAGDLRGTTVAMQGLGNVAGFMIEALLERGVARIVGTDIDAVRVEAVAARFAGAPLELAAVARDDRGVLAVPCDILAPNAVGGILDPDSIPGIRAPIVCGAANNQLAVPARDAEDLRARGIVYVPDFLANRMGIVNCANEQYGVLEHDPVIAAHLDRDTPYGVYRRTLEVLGRAAERGTSTHHEAAALADELLAEPHPIWPHRGRQIIEALVAEGWDRR